MFSQVPAEKEPINSNAWIRGVCDGILRPRIQTIPNDAVNVSDPSRINTFDWTKLRLPLKTNPTFWQLDNIASPFGQAGSLGVESLVDTDKYPADGWELIHRDMGGQYGAESPSSTVDNVTYPMIVLYNRYTGIMRVLTSRMNADFKDDYNLVKYDWNLVNNTTAPYSTSNNDAHLGENVPLDYPFKKGILTSLSDLNNDAGKWFYTDLKTTYDPCVCHFGDETKRSRMSINVWGRKTETVNLSGRIEGTVANQTGYKKPDDRYGISGVQQIGQYLKTAKTIGALVIDVKTGFDKIDSAKKVSFGLDGLLKFFKDIDNASLGKIPYLKGVVTLFDLFIGGGKASAGPTVLSPMVIKSNITLSGTIEATTPFGYISFNTPGTYMGGVEEKFRPFYNEPLGVFNVLRTPEVVETGIVGDVGSYEHLGSTIHIPSHRYKLKEPIKVVLNPASGLYIAEVKAQFVNKFDTRAMILQFDNSVFYDDQDSYDVQEPSLDNGVIPTATDLFDCFNTFYADGTAPTHVRLVMKLKEINGKWSGLYIAKFPVKVVNGTAQVGASACNSLIQQVSLEEVQKFCQSSTYTKERFTSRLGLSNISEEMKVKEFNIDLSTQPNPANDFLEISYKIPMVNQIKIYLTDLSGKNVSDVKEFDAQEVNGNVKFSTQNLASGMYILVFESGNQRTLKKVVVSH